MCYSNEKGKPQTFLYYLFLYVITLVRKKGLGQKKYQGILSTLRKEEFMENSLLIWVNVPLSFKWLCNYFQEMFHLWHLELYLFITLSNYSQQPCDMQYIIKTGQYHAKISFIKNSMKPPSISSNLLEGSSIFLRISIQLFYQGV